MKALRRSIKGEKDKAPHVSIAPKSAVAIVPPKKVIRALYDYEAQSTQELSFSRGDFFHVIGREDDRDWYEACNPALPDARGLVPVNFFQALGRTERDSAQSTMSSTSPGIKAPDHDSGYAETATPAPVQVPMQAQSVRSSKASTGGKSGAMVYGIVMYDFQAERADELDAKAGEAIIVIAQSNPEWFVAKPIGRLGGPGLIPVAFIEIRDMGSNTAVTNPQDAVRAAGIPKVEEWKKMAAEYKNSSITLGKFDSGGGAAAQQQMEQGMDRMSLQSGTVRASQSNGAQSQGRQQQQQQQQGGGYNAQDVQSSGGTTASPLALSPVAAIIPRYCFAEEKYWFVIEATLEDGRHWELSRYYEDFYDFQIALLTEFPAEAGNAGTGQKRTLPYMPGPVNYVTDQITEGRLHNLDAYVKNLLTQPPYIAKCNLVKQFFTPREGDYEVDGNGEEEYRLSDGSRRSSQDTPPEGASRQSSKNNLNGNGYGQRNPNGPGNSRQTSSLSQPSQTSLSPGLNQQASFIKIKVSFNNDLIALRVPSDIQFRDLYEKLRERLKVPAGEQIELFYKDEQTGDKPSLISNNDLDIALQRNEKLMIYVEQV